MKRKFKQWWSSIPLISTKWTITSHLNWTHWKQRKTTTYDVGNPGPTLSTDDCSQLSTYIFLQRPLRWRTDSGLSMALAGYHTKGQAHVDHNGYLVWRKWHFSVTLKVALIDSPIGVKHQLEEYFSYIVAVYIIKEYVHCNHNGRLFCSLSMKHYLLAAIKSRCHSLFIG